MATMSLSCIVSEIDGDFSRKSQIFPAPVYFALQPKVFPLEFSIGSWCQKLELEVCALCGDADPRRVCRELHFDFV